MIKSEGYFVEVGKIYKGINEIENVGNDEVLVKIEVCGLCRTDLHILDGEIPFTKYPIIPGHQIIGRVLQKGENVENIDVGNRVGIYWLYSSCQNCEYCRRGKENLCDKAEFTGCTVHGGFQELIVAKKDYFVKIPDFYDNYEAAPLMCAGIIGYRAFYFVKDFDSIGIYGFGSAGHIIAQVALSLGKEVLAFIKREDKDTANLAYNLGCKVYYSDEVIEEKHWGSIIFAPVGELVKFALQNTKKGGIVVCGGIHMSDIPPLKYEWLWNERILMSVANVTRKDAIDFWDLISQIYRDKKNKIKLDLDIFKIDEFEKVIEKYRKGQTKKSVVFEMKIV